MRFLNKVKEDKLLLRSVLVVLLIALCHWIQYERSLMIQPLIRTICAFCYVFVATFLGRKCWHVSLFVWALAILYFNRFYNYTSFIMVLIGCGLYEKIEKPFIFIYALAVGACLFIYKDSWTHLAIHGLGCYFFYTIYYKIKISFIENRDEIKLLKERLQSLENENLELKERLEKYDDISEKLDLTFDEENIIKQMSEGKTVKQIEGYCQNTVFSKLKDARVRNGISSNTQLVKIYDEQKKATNELS